MKMIEKDLYDSIRNLVNSEIHSINNDKELRQYFQNEGYEIEKSPLEEVEAARDYYLKNPEMSINKDSEDVRFRVGLPELFTRCYPVKAVTVQTFNRICEKYLQIIRKQEEQIEELLERME